MVACTTTHGGTPTHELAKYPGPAAGRRPARRRSGAGTDECRVRVPAGHRPALARVRRQGAHPRVVRLRDAMLARRQQFYDAFAQDYRKAPTEVEASEFLPVMEEIRHVLGRLKRWMKPVKAWPTNTMLGTSAWVQYQPRGRVLIIAPWNYPLSLCFGPLVSALAAKQHRDHQAIRNDA
ncbi:aldehyde dehydrogenase family protein [Massilia sp. H-1]|nr:aldehyde dehydrogenase family protein [Massilia sp. H-1]